MYRRPKFLEVLLQIRQEMSREADYDIDLFAEKVRTGNFSTELTLDDSNSDKETQNEPLKSRKVKI